MSKTSALARATVPPPKRRRQTALYIPPDLDVRLARYMAARHPNRLNVRNGIFLDAIREKLTREGF